MKNTNEKQRHDLKTLAWIYDKTRGQRLRLLLLIILNIVTASISVCFALVSKGIVDGAVSSDKKTLITYASLLLAVILTEIVLNFVTGIINERLIADLSISFQDDILCNLMKREYSKIISYHSGELLNRMFSDVQVVVGGTINLLPAAAYLIFRLIGAAVVLIILSPGFTLLFLVVGVLICTVMTLMRGKLKHLHKTVQEAGGRVRSCLQDALSGLLVVRVFGAENRTRGRVLVYQEEYRKARFKRRFISLVAGVGFNFIFQMGYFIAMAWGCLGIFYGTMTYGTLTAMLQLVNQIQSPFAGFSGLISQYYTVLASAERIMELEEIPSDTKNETDGEALYKSLREIVFDHVSFTYGRTPVLEDVCTVIPKGEIVSVTGISGGGKSTLFLLMLGAYRPTEGNISFRLSDGNSLSGGVRGLFAYVPQGNYLFSGTLRENVTFFKENVPDEQIWKALKLACAEEFVRELPEGLETPLGEKGHGLSEGQMQRIAVARAVLSGAPILLLDEATSALDEETEAKLLQNIESLKNRTCIVVTHRKAALQICKKHLALENGKITDLN